eukprot:CAMPEP_0119033344 /NCGR_PEP_ID=MMETSP1177-20130426/396_1 /TAXON_ID=2985 /ORGANISM="Ochromonas sp, Strain CCMP1899" /LENGTH=285 /DNA_ID=CAMNT_0006990027 /DNA_START=30 /DNA_END=887 /DNA_ORIENTATION=-
MSGTGGASKMAALAAKRRELVKAQAKKPSAESVETTKVNNLITIAALKEAENQAVAACSAAQQVAAFAVQALNGAQKKFAVQALNGAQKKFSFKAAAQKLMKNSAVNNEGRTNNFYSVVQASRGAHQLATEAAASRALKKKSAPKDSQSEEIMTREIRAELEELKTKALIAKNQEVIAEKRSVDATLAVRLQMEQAEKVMFKMTDSEVRADRFKKANEVAAAIVKARELLYAETVTSNPPENGEVSVYDAKQLAENDLQLKERERERVLAEETLATHLASLPQKT